MGCDLQMARGGWLCGFRARVAPDVPPVEAEDDLEAEQDAEPEPEAIALLLWLLKECDESSSGAHSPGDGISTATLQSALNAHGPSDDGLFDMFARELNSNRESVSEHALTLHPVIRGAADECWRLMSAGDQRTPPVLSPPASPPEDGGLEPTSSTNYVDDDFMSIVDRAASDISGPSFARVAWFCLHHDRFPRRQAIFFLEHPWFDRIVLVMIVADFLLKLVRQATACVHT